MPYFFRVRLCTRTSSSLKVRDCGLSIFAMKFDLDCCPDGPRLSSGLASQSNSSDIRGVDRGCQKYNLPVLETIKSWFFVNESVGLASHECK